MGVMPKQTRLKITDLATALAEHSVCTARSLVNKHAVRLRLDRTFKNDCRDRQSCVHPLLEGNIEYVHQPKECPAQVSARLRAVASSRPPTFLRVDVAASANLLQPSRKLSKVETQ